MKWDDLTSAEIDACERDIPVFMNVGAVEQHGPHLPVATDHLIGGHILDRVDTEHGDDILILPSLKACCSEHHMDFPGTLTVRHETFAAYVSDICASVSRHGFTKFFLFNSHGGNLAIGQVLVEKLGAEYPGMKIGMLTWWQIARAALADIQESGFGGVGHACEFETSILMAMNPALVREGHDRDYVLPKTHHWAEADMLNGPQASLFRSMAEITGGTGVVGAPRFASREKGEAILRAVVAEFSTILKDIRAVRTAAYSS